MTPQLPDSAKSDDFALPVGLPDDPHVSYNPSRLTFYDLDSFQDRALARGEATVRSQGVAPGPCEAELAIKKGFQLRKIIGRGGFGEVWEGIQHSLGRVIAIKRVREDMYERAHQESRSTSFCEAGFRHEALTTGALDHPNIVPVYDFGEDEKGRPLLAMKLVRGKPWDQIIWDDYAEPTQDFLNKHLQILISVCQAVAFAHSRGVVHRDIKPSQVMVGEFGEVVLMDWGLALVHDQTLTTAHESPLKSGVIPTRDSAPNPAGTIAFMAPEQTQKSSINIGPHTDVYLLGGVLYYLLTRTAPHSAPDSKAAFIEAQSGQVIPPQEKADGRDIPEELAQLCMRALEPEIINRLSSAKELIEGIRAYQTGASKRRESEHLVVEARAIIEDEKADYRSLARGLSAIERATGFWPDNPEIEDLREKYHVRFAKAALRNRDLVLARAQTERISNTETRRSLSEEIRKSQLYITRLRWGARFFMGGTILLLIIVSIMSHFLNRRADEAMRLREAAEGGERDAVESRRNAEELVNFLVDDLYKSLERFGRLDLIDRVATEANEYYTNKPIGSQVETLAQGLRRARALRVLGDVQVQDRTRILYEPYQVFTESLRISSDLEKRYPDNIEVLQALGASRFRLGSVMIYMGRIEEGLHELQASEKLNRTVHTREPARSEALLEVARSILLRAEIIGYLGQSEVGDFLTRDALLLLNELEGMESTRTDARRFRAQTHIRMAETFVRLGETEKVAKAIEEARQDLRLMATDNSYELHRRFDFARCQSLEAMIEMQGGSVELANEMNLASIDEMEQVLDFSVRNVQWRRQLVQAYLTQASISSAGGKLEEAVEWASRAVVISRGSAYQDPDNMVSQIWLAVTHGLVGTLMHDYGHDALALGELDSAIGILDGLIRNAPTMLFLRDRRALYSLNRARALFDLGQPGEAERHLLALEEEWTQSERADRPEVRLLIANIKLALGYCFAHRNALPEARQRWEQALAISKDLVEFEEFNRYLAMRAQAAALLLLDRKQEANEVIRVLGARGFMGEDLERLVEEGIW